MTTGRLPNTHFWDPQEPKLLGCETSPKKQVSMKSTILSMKAHHVPSIVD